MKKVGVVLTFFAASLISALGLGADMKGKLCDVNDFHAVGDGFTTNTAALQAAIDYCAKTGGTVYLHDGVYLTGTIHVKSGVHLKIDPTATLKGTQNIDDYPDLFPATQNTQLGSCRKALIYVDSADQVTIDGGGTIDGNGINPNWKGKEYTRPMAVFAALSNNVTVQNITIQNSAMWTMVLFETDNSQVRKIQINSTYGANRDGIDVVDSHHVVIDGNTIASLDDSICLKSGSARGVQDVVVRNNHILMSTKANGLKMGTASTGFFKDILFENDKIEKVRKAAMAVESVDGGDIDNVTFRSIDFQAGSSVFLILGKRDNTKIPGHIQNVTFQDITGETTESWGAAITGSVYDGISYSPQNIQFSRVKIQSTRSSWVVPSDPPEYAGQYPDPDLWKNLPAYGFYIRHLTGLTLKDVSFTPSFFERRKDILTVP